MSKNPQHYTNLARSPHTGDRVRLAAGLGAAIPVDGNDLAKAGNGWPSLYELVQPWWDVDAKPGAKWKGCAGRVWVKRNDGRWSVYGHGVCTAVELEDLCGPGELVTPEPEPGLYEKYRVVRTDGRPVGECFVLETDDPATAPAMLAYAAATDKAKFAADLRERFTEPEPCADIPDEVVEAAMRACVYGPADGEGAMRAALAAADAKRAELAGGVR